MYKPIIGVTMGDPAGVGPEIIVKALSAPELYEITRPIVIGDGGVLEEAADLCSIRVRIHPVRSPSEVCSTPGVLDLLDHKNMDRSLVRWGAPDASCGRAAVQYVMSGADLALKGRIDAMTTAPINKSAMQAAGFPFSGHTELLANKTGTHDVGMMMVGGKLRIMLVTTHCAVRDLSTLITKEKVVSAIRLLHFALTSYFDIPLPRIAVCALNPHAGEEGIFGSEEETVIRPAVREVAETGVHVSGPFPADSLYPLLLRGSYDACVSMYHDQGLIPIKLLAFGHGVNVTVGLPFIRTSVDHGTAYDIAGKGIANPGSLVEAIRMAARMALKKKTGEKGE